MDLHRLFISSQTKVKKNQKDIIKRCISNTAKFSSERYTSFLAKKKKAQLYNAMIIRASETINQEERARVINEYIIEKSKV